MNDQYEVYETVFLNRGYSKVQPVTTRLIKKFPTQLWAEEYIKIKNKTANSQTVFHWYFREILPVFS